LTVRSAASTCPLPTAPGPLLASAQRAVAGIASAFDDWLKLVAGVRTSMAHQLAADDRPLERSTDEWAAASRLLQQVLRTVLLQHVGFAGHQIRRVYDPHVRYGLLPRQ
jgi:hypothetical protein